MDGAARWAEAAGGDNSAGSEEREDEDEDGEEEEEGDEPPAPKALVEFDEASVAADSPPQLSRTLKQWVGRVDAIERKVNEWVAVSKKMDPDVCARLIAEFEGLKQSTNELKTRLIARNTPSADEISAHESNLLKHRNAWVDAGYCRETRKDAQDRGVATTNAMSSSRNCVPRTGINALLIMRPNVHISNKEESDICGTMVRTAHKRAMVRPITFSSNRPGSFKQYPISIYVNSPHSVASCIPRADSVVRTVSHT